MIFLGMANAYVMRTNMSVAIVAMVNHTFIEESGGHGDVEDNECPDSNYTVVSSRLHIIILRMILNNKFDKY